LIGCFDPNDSTSESGANDSTDTSASTTQASLDETSDGNDTQVTATLTDPTADPTTDADESTTAAQESTSGATDTADSSTGDTGPLPACGDFDGRVVYVNMAGADLTMGIVDNAPSAITGNEQLVGTWPGYTSADADELFALVEGHFAPYHVCLTRDEPQVPDYSMIVVSSETHQNPNFIGFGIIDCEDAELNSVNIVVLSEEAGLATTTKAVGLSKHIGHMFGLDGVVDAPDDLMNQFVGTTLNGATFTETCYAKIAGANCESAVECEAGEQQSGPYLESIFGAN